MAPTSIPAQPRSAARHRSDLQAPSATAPGRTPPTPSSTTPPRLRHSRAGRFRGYGCFCYPYDPVEMADLVVASNLSSSPYNSWEIGAEKCLAGNSP
ncbi:unnamed protein product [Urochloa humidicola]